LGRSLVETVFLALILTTLIPPANAITVYARVISATFQLTSGDVIAPHMYAWYIPSGSYVYVSPTQALKSIQVFTAGVLFYPLNSSSLYPNFILDCDSYNSGGFQFGFWYSNNPLYLRVNIPGNNSVAYSYGFTITSYYTMISVKLNTDLSVTFYQNGNVVGNSSVAFYPDMTNMAPLKIYKITNYATAYVSLAYMYSRPLYDSEVNRAYSSYEFNSLNLTMFLDATFWDGTKYVDLSGNNNNAQPYGSVQRVLDNKTWLYHIVQLYNDNQIHFRFFPYGSKIEIYNINGYLVTSFYLYGNPDAGNMIEDYAISLYPGTYIIKAYLLPQSFAPGYPANYCGVVQNTDSNVVVSCSCDGLTDPYGIYIDNPDTSQTYTFTITTTYSLSGDRILLTMYSDSPPKVILKLPLQSYTLQNGSQISLTGLKLRITYIENTTSYQNTIVLTPDNYTGSLTLTFNQYDVITEVALFLYAPTPLQSMPPAPRSVWDIKGWIVMLGYMLGQFLTYIPTALGILVQVGVWFTRLVPLFVAIIPLSIIGALVEGGIEDAVKVASFWYELARKLYDFFIKVIHAIAELIQALKPV